MMRRMPKPLSIAGLLVLLELCACGATQSTLSGPSLRSGMGRGRVRSVRVRLIEAQKEVSRLQDQLAKRDSAVVEALEETAEARRAEEEMRVSLEAAKSEVSALRGELAAAKQAAAAAGAASDDDTGDVARLQSDLTVERSRRLQAEENLDRLRQETSANPYERAAEPSLALAEAQRQIEQLTTTLSDERQQRADLEKRFADLQAQVRSAPAPSTADAGSNEELVALQEQQRRVMAAIQQDLEASRRREEDLQAQLAASQGPDATVLSEQVIGLRAENEALQTTLDEEHRSNRELAAKLQVATRVADLIFKMRSEGQPIAADILKEAGAQ